MTPEQLREGAALLAEARAARVPDDPIALAPEHWAWNRWLRTHAAELLAAARQAQDNAKIVEAARQVIYRWDEQNYHMVGDERQLTALAAAIAAATPSASGADEP